MSKKMVLGYTRAGYAVLLPTGRTPDASSFNDWTRGDHVDASRILAEHGEREPDDQIGSWCERWSKLHRTCSKSRRGMRVRIRGAAETAILSTRRRR
jgi:hypothetical protein